VKQEKMKVNPAILITNGQQHLFDCHDFAKLMSLKNNQQKAIIIFFKITIVPPRCFLTEKNNIVFQVGNNFRSFSYP